jgi:hypothetical protein
LDSETSSEEMSWLAIITVIGQLLLEIFKLINDSRAKKEAGDVELKKQKTEILQSGLRGIIDGDLSRLNSAFEQLRELKKRSN